jgi:hypothetical protein
MDNKDVVETPSPDKCWTTHYTGAAPKGQRCEGLLDHRGQHRCGDERWWVIFEGGKWKVVEC